MRVRFGTFLRHLHRASFAAMLPIVFIHTGTSFYLPTTLLQTGAASPRSERFMLGDWGSLALGRLVKREPVRRYWRRAAELTRVFENFSTNAAGFELVCLQRWLALAEWMKAHGIDECLYLDSDVMLYSDVEAARKTVPAGAGMTVAGISGHTNFIGSRKVLEAYGDSILDHYTRPGGKDELREKYHLFRQTHEGGGISDMSFFTEFREANPGLVADISRVAETEAGPTAFDITLDYTAGYLAEDGLKQIRIGADGHAYATDAASGRPVRFHTLHFQGDRSKQVLTRYATTPAVARHALERQNARLGLAYRAWRRMKGR